jgi:hypothetical protein
LAQVRQKKKSKAKTGGKGRIRTYFKCEQCLGYFKVSKKKLHACVKPSEALLVQHLNDDAREAWFELRELAGRFGDQRIYCSAKAIMFSSRVCYLIVRPKSKHLELCVFLNRKVSDASVHKVVPASKSKHGHIVKVNHRDQVEEPLTSWLLEAWHLAQ